MRIKNIFLPLAVCSLTFLTSCGVVKQVGYFQDYASDTACATSLPVEAEEIKLQPEDKISVLVNSKDPELSAMFNLPTSSIRAGDATGNMYNTGQVSLYTVDNQGEIDLPVLGKVPVAGLSRLEAAGYIKKELITRNLLPDPVVTVEFMNLGISVLGEVNKPGRIPINRDKMTILDALSQAGDLTIHGKRENILVLRNEAGQQKANWINLCSAKEMYASPVYYLQQNDVVYVEPNPMRKRQATVAGNTILTPSFWISLASLLTTITVLFVK